MNGMIPPIGKRPAPFSLRLTFEERARLEQKAAGESLSGYIKERLFDGNQTAVRKRGKAPVKDHILLGQLLALLGSSRLSQNMNQLAKAAHTGNLPLQYDVERQLKSACGDIQAMRLMLMQALGMKSREDQQARESASHVFTRASADVREFTP